MVTTYRFKPGDRINELGLSRQLGVSRTPVRAALNRIAAEGFLTAVSNKGYAMRTDNKEFLRAVRKLNERIRFARWIDIESRIGNMSRGNPPILCR